MADRTGDEREPIDAEQPHDLVTALEQAAEDDPEAARDLGHLLLQTTWLDGGSEAEAWLRRATAARPADVQAAVLLATLLSLQCRQIREAPWGGGPASGDARGPASGGAERRAVEACGLYGTALRLDPGSGAAASGLALLLHDVAVAGDGVPSAATAARRALEINPDDPVALLVLAGQTGDDRLRERAEALSPPIPSARWRAGGPGPPAGHGVPSRFDYFVLDVAVRVTDQGDTAPGLAVLRDIEQVRRFDRYSWPLSRVVAYRYERGLLVARHTAARSSGPDLAERAEEWRARRPPAPGTPLPVGHPVRHDGVMLHYGANGVQWTAGDY
ncbi:hypothetical protein [Actinomadura fibrosa]|uniref:Tetratricopeptide repeat protein n=3 Tax=Actinomadura fibrosa TaxID=111802 RepID=A0ABW2Y201_9ACTN